MLSAAFASGDRPLAGAQSDMYPSSASNSPAVVIGAGPHGLASAAHLLEAGVPTMVFGDALSFWRETMPDGMLLRSASWASSINDPARKLTVSHWYGGQVPERIPLEDFIDYGLWFQAQAVPELDSRRVSAVERRDGEFSVSLSDGEELAASRVVVAAGIRPFAFVPAPFRELPSSLTSHTSGAPPLAGFAGQTVAVVGGGQSALESAALLHEAGARVEVLVRARSVFWLNRGATIDADGTVLPAVTQRTTPGWRQRRGLYWRSAPTDVGGRVTSWIAAAPDVLRHAPRSVREPLAYHCIRPAGAQWLPERLREVKITTARTVVTAREQEGRAALRLDDGSERVVDHVLLGTGYRVDVRRYPFLTGELLSQLRTIDGYPHLGRGMESSVPGLHFVGGPAAASFGPLMRFVVGTAYTGPALAQGVLGQRRPAFHWAF
jgi:hypothetical protein